MKEKVTQLLRHPFISGTSIVFIAGFISNIINYFFNLVMGRFLSKDEYGLLYSLISLIGLFSIFSATLQGVYTRFSAQYHAKGDKVGIRKLFWAGLKLQFIIGTILLGLIVLFSPVINDFLHVEENVLIYTLGVYLFFSILYTLPNSILQGQLRVMVFSIGTILGPIIKLGLGLLFVVMGYSLFGVMGALVASAAIPFLIYFWIFLSDFDYKIEWFSVRKLFNELKGYSSGYFLASIGFAFFTFADVLLVRHFVPEISGQYAALSVMGKAIFYFTSPVYLVFFPLIAQKREKKEKLLGTLLLACIVIVISSVGMSFVYFVFPGLVISVFFPNPEYEILDDYLGIYSLYIMIFSLVSLFHNFFLSIGRTNIYKIILFTTVILVVGLSLFHSSLYQVIGILFASTFILFVLYLIYYLRYERD